MSKKYYDPKPEFVQRMKSLFKDEKDITSFFEIIKISPPSSIRCNTLKISPQELKSRLEQNYTWKISIPFKDFPEIMIIDSDLQPGELGRSLEHLLGYYYIQEISSMLPSIVLNPKHDEKVLDLCASPGSKTTQIASMMNNSGLLIANEISMGRLTILTANTLRCGVSNVIVTKKDGNQLCKHIFEKIPSLKFDKILVDAPCSGEGTIRSTPATNKMWNPKSIIVLSKIQKHLLESALSVLKVGAELVYSTCTHSIEENEEVLDFIINDSKWKNKVELMDIKNQLPKELKTRPGIVEWRYNIKNKNDFADNSIIHREGRAGVEVGISEIVKKFHPSIKNAVRIYPQDNDTEGFFISKLKKIKD